MKFDVDINGNKNIVYVKKDGEVEYTRECSGWFPLNLKYLITKYYNDNTMIYGDVIRLSFDDLEFTSDLKSLLLTTYDVSDIECIHLGGGVTDKFIYLFGMIDLINRSGNKLNDEGLKILSFKKNADFLTTSLYTCLSRNMPEESNFENSWDKKTTYKMCDDVSVVVDDFLKFIYTYYYNKNEKLCIYRFRHFILHNNVREAIEILINKHYNNDLLDKDLLCIMRNEYVITRLENN
jgi:hypothetical protein